MSLFSKSSQTRHNETLKFYSTHISQTADDVSRKLKDGFRVNQIKNFFLGHDTRNSTNKQIICIKQDTSKMPLLIILKQPSVKIVISK